MVIYEWNIETIEVGDIDSTVVDNRFADKLSEYEPKHIINNDSDHRKMLVLVRDDDFGRSWAYVIGGILLDKFVDANTQEVADVPKRFHTEHLNWSKKFAHNSFID
jgi:hypothetical protein